MLLLLLALLVFVMRIMGIRIIVALVIALLREGFDPYLVDDAPDHRTSGLLNLPD
jgi:hypothetical protein